MTVILDPGNAAESYIDSAVRLWRLTAGLWKAKDAADLPAGSGSTPAYVQAVGGSGTFSGAAVQLTAAVTLNRVGEWAVHASFVVGSAPGGTNNPQMNMFKNGASNTAQGTQEMGTGAAGTTWHAFARMTSNGSTTAQLNFTSAPGSGSWGSGQTEAWFIPTPTNPQ